MEVMKLTPEQWKEISHNAHLVAFNEVRDPEMNRVDFVLLCLKDKVPAGYLTFYEFDSESVYFGHGGVFPNIAGTVRVMEMYNFAIRYSKEFYKRIFTYIENTNTTMLKMALHVGFKTCGIKVFNNKIYLQNILELGEVV